MFRGRMGGRRERRRATGDGGIAGVGGVDRAERALTGGRVGVGVGPGAPLIRLHGVYVVFGMCDVRTCRMGARD